MRSVREVVAEFAGLKGTAAQKAVTADVGLSGTSLEDLVVNGGMDGPRVRALLKAMQERSRLIKPAALGVLGDTHLRTILVEGFEVEPESLKYKKYEGTADGLPYVLELACGWYADFGPHTQGQKLLGWNFTPALRDPFPQWSVLLDTARIDVWDPVVLVVHVACPRLEVTDRGRQLWRSPKGSLRS